MSTLAAAHVAYEWEMWGRVVMAGLATRRDIEETWTLGDLFLAHMLLDYREETQRVLQSRESEV